MTIHHVDHCRLVSYDDDICENYIDDETHNSMKNQIETFSDVKNEVKDVPKIIQWVRHLRAKIPRVGRHISLSSYHQYYHLHPVQLYSYA